jgi:hypothetical protein
VRIGDVAVLPHHALFMSHFFPSCHAPEGKLSEGHVDYRAALTSYVSGEMTHW